MASATPASLTADLHTWVLWLGLCFTFPSGDVETLFDLGGARLVAS